MIFNKSLLIKGLACVLVLLQGIQVNGDEQQDSRPAITNEWREWREVIRKDFLIEPPGPAKLIDVLDELAEKLRWNHLQNELYTVDILYAQVNTYQDVMGSVLSVLSHRHADDDTDKKYRDASRLALQVDSLWANKMARLQVASAEGAESRAQLFHELGNMAAKHGQGFFGAPEPNQLQFDSEGQEREYVRLYNRFRQASEMESIHGALSSIQRLNDRRRRTPLHTLSSFKNWIGASELADAITARGLSREQRRGLWEDLSELRNFDLPSIASFDFIEIQDKE